MVSIQDQKESSANSDELIGTNVSRAISKVSKGLSTTKQSKGILGIALGYGAARRKITSDS